MRNVPEQRPTKFKTIVVDVSLLHFMYEVCVRIIQHSAPTFQLRSGALVCAIVVEFSLCPSHWFRSFCFAIVRQAF